VKLIRDGTPHLERGSTRHCESDGEYELALRAKLMEEAAEVAAATSREEMLAELGDLHTVLRLLARLNGINGEQIEDAAIEKLSQKGGFSGRLLLVHDPLSNKHTGS
jgi:predicted house-cleaning noncanonical NTP pyrophosphatase (MazG superfamily)